MAALSTLPSLQLSTDIKDKQYDGVVIVGENPESLATNLSALQSTLKTYLEIDKAASSSTVSVILCPDLPSRRLVFSPTGPLNRDQDDVRRFYDAAGAGIKRALAAGCKAPLLVTVKSARFDLSQRVTVLGALQTLYNPLELREAKPDKVKKADKLGLFIEGSTDKEIKILNAIESGRTVYRDIGGSDPERMAAPRVAEYVQQIFKDTCIKVDVIQDVDKLTKEYPLLAAVNRACRNVPRHAARLIFLEYVGEGTIDTTLMLVGKGITYDTGGADLKVNGHMAGMHRDKCGAACVAGFFQLLSIYKPKGLKVIGSMSMVRNSIGSECYVADEIITSRAGVRVRVGNTDAEGRMVMADPLCLMKEKAAGEVNPFLFTIATLTGHVIRAFGPDYTGVMENGPARQAGVAKKLQEAGDLSGDPFEISTIRREQQQTTTTVLSPFLPVYGGKSEYEDVLQCGNNPSAMTNRGHQAPGAFLIMASGLDKHGIDSDKPLRYSHVDIAGSSGPFPGVPTGAPIPALAHAFVLNRESSA